MFSADIGHSFTGDFSLFEDFDDLTFADSGSFHGEALIPILSCTSTFLLGIIFGAPYQHAMINVRWRRKMMQCIMFPKFFANRT